MERPTPPPPWSTRGGLPLHLPSRQRGPRRRGQLGEASPLWRAAGASRRVRGRRARRGAGRGEERGGAWVRPTWREAAGPRRRSRAEPVLAGDAAGACVDLVLQPAGVRAPPPLLVPWSQACGRRRRSEAHAADGEEEEGSPVVVGEGRKWVKPFFTVGAPNY